MRRVVLLALLALALPLTAYANTGNLVFTNSGGFVKLKNNNTLSGSSTLTSFTGLNGVPISGNLGTVSYSTGALLSGNVGSSATFGAGGFFKIVGNGTNGIPAGVLFTGTFTSNVNWVGTFNPAGNNGKGNWTYTLTGVVTGVLSNGTKVSGGTIQFTFDVPGSKPFSKIVRINHGVTTVTVPEPGTLGLLGTGLIGIAGLIRRRFAA
ncbi:MAG TPA: PEP-CTERM sorting domain-containing protein [Terriglobales bacterium]|nr:PEP-CTERM sorting domain-containing protein [Terriglobales bacterium]